MVMHIHMHKLRPANAHTRYVICHILNALLWVAAEAPLVAAILQCLVGLELAIDPPPPRGNFVHYDFLKLHYIRHKIKYVSPLRVAALTCNST